MRLVPPNGRDEPAGGPGRNRVLSGLFGPSPGTRPAWRPTTVGLALGIHLCLGGALAAGSLLPASQPTAQQEDERFLQFLPRTALAERAPLPAAGPPAPAAAGETVVPPVEGQPPETAETVQPTDVPTGVSAPEPSQPAPVAAADADDDGTEADVIAASSMAGSPGGVVGGVAGGARDGVAGGVAGGVVGGVPWGVPGGSLDPEALSIGAVVPPQVLERVQPQYPPMARRARIEGEVRLNAEILSDGSVGEIEVIHGLGLGCTEAAIEALEHWRFRPAERDGVPVDAWFELTVEFILS